MEYIIFIGIAYIVVKVLGGGGGHSSDGISACRGRYDSHGYHFDHKGDQGYHTHVGKGKNRTTVNLDGYDLNKKY